MTQPTNADWERLRGAEAAVLSHLPAPLAPRDIEIAGASLHYLEGGNPALPPLVMVHGRGSAGLLWWPIMPQLAAHRHLIAVDMRGWGLSSRAPFTGTSGPDAIAWWRDGVLGIVDALGITRFDLIGHSLGGMVSLAIALERPGAIDHLLLEDAAGFAKTSPPGTRIYFWMQPERLARMASRGLFDRVAAGSTPIPYPAPELKRAMQDFVYALTTFPGTAESGARAFSQILGLGSVRYTLRDQVAKIAAMTRVFWGTRDGLVPFKTSEEAIRTMPNADIVAFGGAGHSPHMELPDAFARRALEFLARGAETPVINTAE